MSTGTDANNETFPTVTSTPESLDLIIYEKGPASICETRRVTLVQGNNTLLLTGIVGYVPDSFMIDRFEGPGNFIPGLTSYDSAKQPERAALLKSAIGRKVTLLVEHADGQVDDVVGNLQRVTSSFVIVRDDEGRDHVRRVPQEFDLDGQFGAELFAEAAVTLDCFVSEPGDYVLYTMYEAIGLSWTPTRYEAELDAPNDVIRSLTAWSTIANSTTERLEHVQVSLMTGMNESQLLIHQPVHNRGHAYNLTAASMNEVEESVPQRAAAPSKSVNYGGQTGTSESVGEQELYPVSHPVTLEPGQSKQAVILAFGDVPVETNFLIPAGNYEVFQGAPNTPGWISKDYAKWEVQIRLDGNNTMEGKLGRALPPAPVLISERLLRGRKARTNSSSVTKMIAVGDTVPWPLKKGSKNLKFFRRLVDYQEELIEEIPDPEQPEPPAELPGHVTAEVVTARATTATRTAPAVKMINVTRKYECRQVRDLIIFNFGTEAANITASERTPAKSTLVSSSVPFTYWNANGSAVLSVLTTGPITVVTYELKHIVERREQIRKEATPAS